MLEVRQKFNHPFLGDGIFLFGVDLNLDAFIRITFESMNEADQPLFEMNKDGVIYTRNAGIFEALTNFQQICLEGRITENNARQSLCVPASKVQIYDIVYVADLFIKWNGSVKRRNAFYALVKDVLELHSLTTAVPALGGVDATIRLPD